MQKAPAKHADKLRFMLVGGTNTVIDFGILFGLVALGLDKLVANFVSTSLAFTFSFFVNKSYTFKDNSKTTKRQIVLFLSITLIGLWIIQPLIIALIYPLFEASGLNRESSLLVSKLIATVVTMAWNYLLYRKFVFRGEVS